MSMLMVMFINYLLYIGNHPETVKILDDFTVFTASDGIEIFVPVQGAIKSMTLLLPFFAPLYQGRRRRAPLPGSEASIPGP